MTAAPEPNSRIFYRGPSQLDGQPILGIISGLATPSTNTKTGDMLQTYILLEKVAPPEAVRTGADRSICGDCALRGDGLGLGRSCYVQTKWAPLSVWKVLTQRQRHTLWGDGVGPAATEDRSAIAAELPGRFLRVGSYGDPTAIPLYVWQWLLGGGISGWTGYTHQWADPRFQGFRGICMASVDTRIDHDLAVELGWRTFRTRRSLQVAREPREIICPASAEAGHQVTCAQCRLCNGRQGRDERKHIVIVAHGSRARTFGAPVLPFEQGIEP